MKYRCLIFLLASLESIYCVNMNINAATQALNEIFQMSPNNSPSDTTQFVNKLHAYYSNSTLLDSGSDMHKYIIKLDDNISPSARNSITQFLSGLSCNIKNHFDMVFKGMTLETDVELPSDILQEIPYFNNIEKDIKMRHYQVEDTDARLWGLDLVDQTSGPPNGKYVFDLTGKGVNIYIIDTGVDSTHPELNGRAQTVFVSQALNGSTIDCTGHGTHVSGISGGTNVGVAKEASINGVKVIGCDGETWNSDVITGLEWVVTNHQKPAVINMSLGPSKQADGTYPSSEALNDAVSSANGAGIVVVVAAGNDNSDGCQGSPSVSPGAITIAATDINRNKAWFSNYGSCVALFAPGDGIYSSIPGGYGTKWGTSQAAPFVTGMAALILQENPTYTPAQVLSALQSAGLQNVVQNAMGSQNIFVHSVSVPAVNSPEYNQQYVTLFSLPRMTLAEWFSFLSPVDKGLVITAIVVVGLLILSLGAFCWFKRRKRTTQAKALGQPPML